ncbi:hypothetical protein E2562_027054 [Oryza meyeriana var. granulata]|uniref:Fungal lipase-type domain-containing protein n=1 Tax=Oryza meyeriana var. granulata TaxID=110450 RepID=A0A6G1C973_9ORYZ|nr:hypothetical protein E2562_027054 [Oryza meyeriana var. granulata]
MSFGGPRVGNGAFRLRLEESGGKVLRAVNSNDIVTKVPGFSVVNEEEVEGAEVARVQDGLGVQRRRRRPRAAPLKLKC